VLDYVDAPSVAGRVQAVRLASGRKALWIEVDGGGGGSPRLHITSQYPATTETGTRNDPGFDPRGLVGLDGRLITLNGNSNRLAWSGRDDPTANAGKGYVTVWAAATDIDEYATKGGFVSLYSSGSLPIAVSEYRGRVAVLARATVQLWAMDDGGVGALDQTISGPGVQHLGTIGSMAGDLIYVDASGTVRMLSTDTQTEGAKEEGTIGEPVVALTSQLAAPGATPYGIYARALGCYLLAYGNTVACLAMVSGQVKGWSRWNLPVNVDGIAEVRGQVSIRSGNALYQFSDIAPDDEVATGDHRSIPITIRPVPLQSNAFMTLNAVGGAVAGGSWTIAAIVDGVATAAAPIIPRAPRLARRTISRTGRSLSLELVCAAAPAGARCDAAFIDASKD
jgi:hypothetical protein